MIHRLGVVLLMGLCASFCVTELAEADLHWHLLAGGEIVESGRVPQVDTFSYTSNGNRWIDLHWGFQALAALVYRAAGWGGLDVLKILLLTTAFGVALRAAARRGAPPEIFLPVGLLALVASQERFSLRPEALSFLLLAIVLWVLDRRHRRPGLLFAVPALLAVWANLHALYAVGLGLFILTLIGDAVDARLKPGAARAMPLDRWRSVGLAALSLVATALTPYGFAGWDLPRRLLFERIGTDNVYARNIAEFQAPFGGFGPTTAIAAFAILALVVLAAGIAALPRAASADLLVLSASLTLALLARRNVPLFALVALPAGSTLIVEARERWRARRAATGSPPRRAGRRAAMVVPALVGAVALVLLADVWSNRFFERDGTQRYFGRGLSPGFYPEGAAAFVLRERLPGEAIHDLSMGGFLAWVWHPQRRVFIDGRLEVHDEALFETYLRLQSDPAAFEEAAARLGATVVIPRFRPESAPLIRHLTDDPRWRLVYLDLAAAVYVRSDIRPDLRRLDPGDPALGTRLLDEVRQAGEASSARDPAPRLLRRVLPRREVPVAAVNAGLFFGVIGRHANAALLFGEALAKAPENVVLHYDLGLVLEQAGRTAEARREYGRAIQIDPGFAPARVALALRLLRDGDPDAAMREWARAERDGRLGPASLQARGALLAARGRLDEAIQDYRAAAQGDPGRADLHADLALLYQRRGLRDQAQRAIQRALAIDDGACVARAALARMRAAEGARAEAEALLRELVENHRGCAAGLVALASLAAQSGRTGEAAKLTAEALLAGADPAVIRGDPALQRFAAGAAGGGPAGVSP